MTTGTGGVLLGGRGRARGLGTEAAAGTLVGVSAAAAGALLASGRLQLAFLAVAIPAAVLLSLHFPVAAVLLAVSLPVPISLVGGGAGVNVAASDLFLALLLAVVVVEWARGRLPGLGEAVLPAVIVMAPYLTWLAVLLAAHLSPANAVQTAQRLELFFVPVLVGAAIGLRGVVVPVLRGYVIAATVFAALYPFFSNGDGGLGVQKNPAGQVIANALILIIAVRSLWGRWLIAVTPVLVLGLLWTMSRGAILSVGIGVAVLALAARGAERGRLLRLLVPLLVVVMGAFALLPDEAKERNTDFSTTSGTAAARSAEDRSRFREEAAALIRSDPLFGVGVGNYLQGTATMKPSSADPHNVFVLQEAEGGYPFAGAFVILVVGAAVVVLRQARGHPMGAAASAVLVACVGHGLVDVYWVRGTPVLGWLLIGIALGVISRGDGTHGRAEKPDGAQQARPLGGLR